MALLSMLLVMCLGTLFPSMRTVKQAEESVSTQLQMTLAFDRLTAELSCSDPGSITIFGNGISFLSHQQYQGSASPLSPVYLKLPGYITPGTEWRKFVVLFHWEREVMRREIPFDLGQELAFIDPVRVDDVVNSPDYPERVWLRDVEDFQVTMAGASEVRFALAVVSRRARKLQASEGNFTVSLRSAL